MTSRARSSRRPSQTSPTLSFTDIALSDTGVYSCEVTNTIVTNLSLYSRNIVLKVENNATSINEQTASKIHIYPNPSKGLVTIDNLPDYMTDIKMLDMNGKVVRQWNCVTNNNTIDISDLSSGNYLIHIPNVLDVPQMIIKQ